MAKKKFYAVKVGKTPGIFSTWNECEEQTKGFSGAVYKSFSSLEEAEHYMIDGEATELPHVIRNGEQSALSTDDFNMMVNGKISSLKSDEAVAFVDGSYDVTEEKSAFGSIIISSDGNKDTLYKAFTKNLGEDFISLRNVAAELEGVKEAVNWTPKRTKVLIIFRIFQKMVLVYMNVIARIR